MRTVLLLVAALIAGGVPAAGATAQQREVDLLITGAALNDSIVSVTMGRGGARAC